IKARDDEGCHLLLMWSNTFYKELPSPGSGTWWFRHIARFLINS
ncbi:hypothetical protein AVEN_144553-1, partial [Araneus ventricosus]